MLSVEETNAALAKELVDDAINTAPVLYHVI
jgi:hypothetical protein